MRAFSFSRFAVLLIFGIAAAVFPLTGSYAHTGDKAGSGCSNRSVTYNGIGVCVSLPHGLTGKVNRPDRVIEFYSRSSTAGGPLWATMYGLEVAPNKSARAAASRGAEDLLTAFAHERGFKRAWGHVAGAPALFLRDIKFDEEQQLATVVLVAYRGGDKGAKATRPVIVIYLIGGSPDHAQKALVRSIQFVPRKPVFACNTSPYLSVAPNPVTLHHPLSVVLSCGDPGRSYGFGIRPANKRAFGGGIMGRHRADAHGSIVFTYPGFRRAIDSGAWVTTATELGKDGSSAQRRLFVRHSR